MLCRGCSGLVLAVVLILLAGCGESSTRSLLANGIGTDIYVSDSKERADLLEGYFGIMCGRAGVLVTRGNNDRPLCSYSSLTPDDWRNVVRASMNDVDERCDTYLETVDNARRDRDAYRKQLSDTETQGTAILGLNRGVLTEITKKHLALVSQAFGFTRNSLDNYYSRLILEVEKSSLRSLVKKRQTAYRNRLEDPNTGMMKYVLDKSSSYYAMRGYLRLCTPTSIETEIKATVAGLNYKKDGERGTTGNEADPDLASLAALPRTR